MRVLPCRWVAEPAVGSVSLRRSGGRGVSPKRGLGGPIRRGRMARLGRVTRLGRARRSLPVRPSGVRWLRDPRRPTGVPVIHAHPEAQASLHAARPALQGRERVCAARDVAAAVALLRADRGRRKGLDGGRVRRLPCAGGCGSSRPDAATAPWSDRWSLAGEAEERQGGDQDHSRDHERLCGCAEDHGGNRPSLSREPCRCQAAPRHPATDHGPDQQRGQDHLLRTADRARSAVREGNRLSQEQCRGSADHRPDQGRDHQRRAPIERSPHESRRDMSGDPHGNDDDPANRGPVERTDIRAAVADPPQDIREPRQRAWDDHRHDLSGPGVLARCRRGAHSCHDKPPSQSTH